MNHTIHIRKSSRSSAIGRTALAQLARRVATRVLDGERLRAAELGVWFVDDPVIHRLNRRYRRVNRPTDVIAFTLSDRRERRRPGAMLGDVVISVTTAHRQARRLGHSLRAEIALLLIHGILHLLDYDHHNPAATRLMRRKERLHLDACGFPGAGG